MEFISRAIPQGVDDAAMRGAKLGEGRAMNLRQSSTHMIRSSDCKVHVGNLVEVRNWIVPKNDPYDKGTWQTEYRFQNVNTAANISYSGGNYKFLSFIYNGATRTRTGDNIEASLLVTTNQISMDIAYASSKADHSKKQIVVRTA